VVAALALACGLSCAAGPSRPGPRRVVDDLGVALHLPPLPRRIVSLSPDVTETLYALGRGEAVVGVSSACDRPEAARALPRVGSMVQPSIERIVALRPDLVIASASGNPLDTVTRLRELGVAVHGVRPRATGVRGVADAVRSIARAAGVEAEGARAASDLLERLERLRREAAGASRGRACCLVWLDPPIAAGATSFAGDILDAVGLDNACARGDEDYPRLSAEALLLAAPDWLLVATGESGPPPTPASLGSWAAGIPAFTAGRVLVLDDRYLRPTLQLADAAEDLARRVAR
jgi:iron complex transport system substrate-binding protein